MNDQQQIELQQQKIPFTRRVICAMWCGVIGGLFGLVTSIAQGQSEYGGMMGFAIGGVIGYKLGPEWKDWFSTHIELPESLIHRLRRSTPESVGVSEEEVPSLESPPPLSTRTAILADPVVDTGRTSVLAPPAGESQTPVEPDDTLFTDDAIFNPLPMRRANIPEILRNSKPNDYQVVVGRSLDSNSPSYGVAKRIRFFMKHLKVIGTTQFGKSSLVAYLLWVIGQTHDPAHVQFAIFDLEYRTCQLFLDDPHIISVSRQGHNVPLFTTECLEEANRQQILPEEARIQQITEMMGYLYILMTKRYGLSLAEQEELPLLIVYIEEFLVLKDTLKSNMSRGSAEEQEKAKRVYAEFMHRFIQIARRGLKVKIQFLVCAQLKYRDEDLLEAWGNITDGFAFCVPPTAAQSAGFFQSSLINANAKAKVQGQFVCEVPGLNEMVLAPDFDLKEKLLAIQKKQPKSVRVMNVDDEPMPLREVYALPQQYERVSSSPGYQLPQVQPDPHLLTRLHHACLEHYQPGIGYRQLGELIGVGKDKAGDLLRDLKKWGFIEDDSDQ